jgi:hypothetical protein
MLDLKLYILWLFRSNLLQKVQRCNYGNMHFV